MHPTDDAGLLWIVLLYGLTWTITSALLKPDPCVCGARERRVLPAAGGSPGRLKKERRR